LKVCQIRGPCVVSPRDDLPHSGLGVRVPIGMPPPPHPTSSPP
jgi:hypothetical protein